MSRRPDIDRWWYTQQETAKRLRIGVKTVRKMMRSGELPSVQLGPRRVIRVEVVEEMCRPRKAS